MRKVINNLRKQPEEVRRHVLHVITLVFGVILASLWIYSLGTGPVATEEANQANVLEPLSVLKDNFINGYQSISEEE